MSRWRGKIPLLIRRERLALENLADRIVGLIPEQLAPIGDLGEDVIQAGNDEHANHRTHEHAADACGADGPIANGSRPGRKDERNQTGDEREARLAIETVGLAPVAGPTPGDRSDSPCVWLTSRSQPARVPAAQQNV